MSKIKISQNKSIIKRPAVQKKTLAALGIKKMNHSIEVEATPQVMGMVNKIKHLLIVEKI
jgi:large subunit ribosomal protein L30